MTVVAVLMWVVCGVVSAGYMYPFLQSGCEHNTDSDRIADRNFSVGIGLLGGPLTLALTCIVAEPTRHGWSIPIGIGRDDEYDAYPDDDEDEAA